MARPFEPFPAGSIVAGKLRIMQPLGFGGMGAVYEVEHTLTHHRRALKLLHAEMRNTPGIVERFLREASAAGRIGNPHIVETFDAGYLETGEPYIVMELLKGKTLAALLERGPLAIDQACAILGQVADGVFAAHAAGIVHRDLKPENIFLTGPDTSFVKLLDFGVSKFDAAATGVENLTLEGSPIGTPYYMAPEQIRGAKSVDARTDVYALGVLLYECVTGRKPFVADTLPQLILLIHDGRYAPASTLRPGLSPSVDAVVARAMAGDPAARYATAQEFGGQLGRLRDSFAPAPAHDVRPAMTQPELPLGGTLTPAPVSRGSEPPRRSRPARVVGLTAAGLGVAGAIAAWLWFHARSVEVPSPEGAAAGTSTQDGSRAAAPGPSRVEPAKTPAAEVAPSTAPPASASVSPAVSAAPRASASAAPRVAPRPSAAASSRAREHGLSEDNPFR